MKGTLIFTFVLCSLFAQAQNNITKTAGINYTNGIPTMAVKEATGSEIAIDTATGFVYQYHRTAGPSELGGWRVLGQGIDVRVDAIAPSYTPFRNQSVFVVNAVNELYFYSGGSWNLLNGSGGGGGTNLTFTGASSPYTLNSSTGTDVTIAAGTGVTLSRSSNELTVTNSAPDQTVSIAGAGINVATGTYPNFTVTGTEVDGSTTNEIQTYGHAGTTTYTNTLSNGGGSWSITGAGIAAISNTAGAVTVTATEVDGSTSNELQTVTSTSDATSHTVTLSNTGGSIQLVEGANVTLTTTGTGADGIVTIAATSGSGTDLSISGTSSPLTVNSSSGTDVTLTAGTGITLAGTASDATITNSAPDQTVSITGAGINNVTGTYPNFTVTGTEVDGSVSNEGSLTVGAGSGTTSTIVSNTSGSTAVTISASTGLSISEAGSTITLTNSAPDQTVSITGAGINNVTGTYPNFTVTGTEVDGSTTNEIQQIDTFTIVSNVLRASLSSDGVPFKSVSLTPYLDNVSTDLSISGTSSPLTLNSSDGTDVTLTAGTGITLAGTSGNATITNSAPDQTVSITGAGINVATGTYPNFTVTGTEVDGSTTNEIQTITNTSNATTHTATLSNTGGSLQLVEGSNITLTTTGTGADGIVTIAATGGSGDVATDAIWDAAGDIVQGTGANTAARLAIGTANQQLRVNAGATALEYFTPSASGDIVNGGNTTGATVVIGTNDANALQFETNNVTRASITGGASTGGALTLTDVTSNTSTVEDALTIQTNSSGTAAAGFGGGIKFKGESSTTDNQDMGAIQSLWTTATHASRTSALAFSTLTAAGSLTERMRILGDGNVGIGNTAPVSPLAVGPNITGSPVYGFTLVGDSGNEATAGFQNTSASGYSGFLLYDQSGTYSASVQFGNSGTGLPNAFFLGNRLASGPMYLVSGPGADIKATMLTDGRFGFGTTTPTARLHVVQTAAASGALTGIIYTGAINTSQTASTEIPAVTLTTAGRQWATGALTTQREVLITQPTYSFAGASTITNAATLGIAGAPIKSTNATITNTHGVLVQAGAVSTATNAYGLTVNAPTGATNNYAAQFIGGNVGIGTAAPAQPLDVTGNAIVAGNLASTRNTATLGAAATTLAVTRNVVTVTGDAGGNTLATITGGLSGQILTLIFVDALVTITDDATATANTVNLSAAFTSTANDTITLVFDGTSWRETNRSIN